MPDPNFFVAVAIIIASLGVVAGVVAGKSTFSTLMRWRTFRRWYNHGYDEIAPIKYIENPDGTTTATMDPIVVSRPTLWDHVRGRLSSIFRIP